MVDERIHPLLSMKTGKDDFMTCSKCQHDQPDGKFCEACGNSLFEPNGGASASTALAVVSPQPGQSEFTKKTSQYWNHSIATLKQPLDAFRSSAESFGQGVTTLLLYMAVFTISVYFIANSLFKQLNVFWLESAESLPFFTISSRVFLFSFVTMAISLFVLFVVVRWMKLGIDGKRLTAQYGALLLPFLAVNVLAMLFALSGTASVTFILLGASVFYTALIVPSLFIYHHGMQQGKTAAFYGSIGTSLLILLLSYFFWRWLMIEKINEITAYF
ncbi:zinc ribbon domain-containing protein [Halobacillus litoralis]|uniref:zinc ribbon domain-containing protein n=1 Tax=Halobacillus litoralis TaxID=45668 RepID=UPI001CFF0BB2|nr:zinc ribbon domain-containing protein [Halobacillus litoralis]